jgi:GntR family transcriptional regulator/MocR family aminotransferase
MPLIPIDLDRHKKASLQAQLASTLKRGIQSGELAPGQALPSTRELAVDLAVSRNTVVNAYDQLVSEGYIEPRPRSGLFVSESLSGIREALPTDHSKLLQEARLPNPSGPRPFRPCQPDVRLFPLAMWNRIRARTLNRNGPALLAYQSNTRLGWPPLQKALAEYVSESRSVRCSWQQVAVTSGSQQALYLLSQLLLSAGKRTVLMEDPGYPGALAAFRAAGANILPVSVDAEGMIPPQRIPPGALVYTTPSRQFPTGAVMTMPRRLALLQAAQKASAYIIEDDYDSEFRYSRAPMPSLHSLHTAGRVIYVGSMSKALIPTLRIGYAVLPDELIESFGTLRTVVDDHGPLIDQATLADFIASGGLYSHIRRCRKEYRRRLEVFLTTVQAHRLALDFRHTDGGMNLCALFPSNGTRDDVRISKLAGAKGLDVAAVSTYTLESKLQGLLFGFTAFDPMLIRSSLRKLAPLLR